MSDIFREVDEAMQQEKLLNIWNEYKNTIIAAIAILIVSAAGTNIYHSWNNSRNAEETARLMQAMESNAPQDSLMEVIGDTRGNHAAVGRFIAANLALENDDKAKAVTIYEEAAKDRSTPRDLRDLARILFVKNSDAPTLDILKPLLADDKSPWVWHARIEAAAMAANDGDYDQALKHLEKFESVTTIPLSLKQRGNALRHVYELKKSDG